MGKIAQSMIDLVGNTPLVQLNAVTKGLSATIYGKCEFFNPAASVKDRPAKWMFEAAESQGLITKDSVIIEPTSGNTGIALAFIGAVKGYRVILVMPDSMSLERQKLLRAFGAELELTPGHLGMSGAINRAKEMADQIDNSFIPQQFENIANPTAHAESTALEIWDATDGDIDMIVTGVGTGGSITGITRALKEKNSNFEAIAVEPADSPVISGGEPGPHMLQGIGAGFIPKNLDTSLLSGVVKVSNEDALEMARRLAKEEGVLVGISAGANVYAAIEVAKRPENAGKKIVTILCDTGERYLSTTLYK